MPSQIRSDTFTGFPAEAFTFFRQLTRNNNRDWFLGKKEVYERSCRTPLAQFIEALGGNASSSRITRMNRDIRFSRDKSPYRTYIAGGVSGNYISLSADGLFVGTGLYKPEPAVLGRLRDAIADEKSGRELERIVQQLRKAG